MTEVRGFDSWLPGEIQVMFPEPLYGIDMIWRGRSSLVDTSQKRPSLTRRQPWELPCGFDFRLEDRGNSRQAPGKTRYKHVEVGARLNEIIVAHEVGVQSPYQEQVARLDAVILARGSFVGGGLKKPLQARGKHQAQPAGVQSQTLVPGGTIPKIAILGCNTTLEGGI